VTTDTTPSEHHDRIVGWLKNGLTVAMFGVMFFAINRLLRAYSYAEIVAALTRISPALIVTAIGVLAIQHGFLVIREWLAVGYAGKSDVGLGRIALASVVTRSLGSLGFASITGVGLRLHIYSGWGLTSSDVAEISIYDNTVFLVGIASQFALTFTALPIPATLEHSLGVVGVRLIGALAILLVGAYVLWSRRGHEIHIRKFVIPVPNGKQLVGQILLPIVDLALTALIVELCLPGGLELTYFDVMIACVVASIASSITQVPAGVGVLEGTMLLFVGKPDLAPSVIAGLFVWRLITNLLPIAVGAISLVVIEVRRRPSVARPPFHAEATATMLAALTFVAGAVVMIVSASPLGDRLGNLGQVLAVAAGSGMLFVARGLQRRTRLSWWITLGLLAIRVAVGLAVQPALYVIIVLVVVGTLLVLSRSVFTAETHFLDASPRWWIASATVLVVTIWIAFVASGRVITPWIDAEVVGIVGVAALAIASAVASFVHHDRKR